MLDTSAVAVATTAVERCCASLSALVGGLEKGIYEMKILLHQKDTDHQASSDHESRNLMV
jgi:hypothetical protein